MKLSKQASNILLIEECVSNFYDSDVFEDYFEEEKNCCAYHKNINVPLSREFFPNCTSTLTRIYVLQTAIRHFFLGEDVKQANDFPRLHHQLLPMTLKYNEGFPPVSGATCAIDGLRRVLTTSDQMAPLVFANI